MLILYRSGLYCVFGGNSLCEFESGCSRSSEIYGQHGSEIRIEEDFLCICHPRPWAPQSASSLTSVKWSSWISHSMRYSFNKAKILNPVESNVFFFYSICFVVPSLLSRNETHIYDSLSTWIIKKTHIILNYSIKKQHKSKSL